MQNDSQLGLDVFFMIRLESWIWGRKSTEVQCHSHHVFPVQFMCDVNLDHLIEVVFVRFLPSKAIFFLLFHITLFKRTSLRLVQTEGVRSYAPPPWAQSIYTNYLEFVLPKRFVYLPNLFFIQSFLYQFDLWVFILYFMWLSNKLDWLCCWNHFSFEWAFGSTFNWLLYLLHLPPSLWSLGVLFVLLFCFILFLRTSLFSGTMGCSRIILYKSFSSPRIRYFSKKSWFFLLANDF